MALTCGLAVWLLAGLLVATPLTPRATGAAGVAPRRILIVGDSVTQGYRGDFTWRYFAWRALQRGGGGVDFVGPRTGPFFVHDDGSWDWDYTGADAYADPDFDQDHGAFYGGRLGPEDNWFHQPIGAEVARSAPEVIVSLWGVNDLEHGDDGPADLLASYRSWVAEARSVDPDVDFVIGELPYTWVDEVPEFDAMLPALAAELTTDRSRIVVATMDEPYTREDDSIDRVHPNTEGQRKIARMMVTALALLPADPDSPTPPVVVPPAPPAPDPVVAPVDVAKALDTHTAPRSPRGVRAVRTGDGRRTRVTWREVRSAESYAVRCGTARTVVTGRATVLRSRSVRCRVRASSAAGASAWVAVRVHRGAGRR